MQCSLIHSSLLGGCDVAYRALGLKVQWGGGSPLYHEGEVILSMGIGSATVTTF